LYRDTSLLIPFSYQTTAWLFNQPLLRDVFHWDTFDHPPYSPDLPPSDLYLFSKTKEHLTGKRFTDDEDQQHAVMDWLTSQAAVWYEEGISKLVSQYDKCLNVQGDYVDKWVKVCDKTCLFCFFPIINKYLCMAKRSLLSERPTYIQISSTAN
jgi:hypothetical protein